MRELNWFETLIERIKIWWIESHCKHDFVDDGPTYFVMFCSKCGAEKYKDGR
jgi:hypothetical protein